MNYLNRLLNEIANNYVFDKQSYDINENYEYYQFSGVSNDVKKIVFGIAPTGSYYSPTINVYYDENTDFNVVNQTIGHYGKYAKFRAIKTSRFESYQLTHGSSIRHAQLNGHGTLGGFALDLSSNKILIVSNNHVIANSNNCNIGDYITDTNQVNCGRLERYMPLLLPPNINEIDAAVSTIFQGKMIGTYNQNRRLPSTARIGEKVYKIGARTGLTYGTVISDNGFINIYNPALGQLNFVNTLVIESVDNNPFSLPGDSGSFIFNKFDKVIGLLFGGNSLGNITFANPIRPVIDRLGLRF